jgi:hypothetical protein
VLEGTGAGFVARDVHAAFAVAALWVRILGGGLWRSVPLSPRRRR